MIQLDRQQKVCLDEGVHLFGRSEDHWDRLLDNTITILKDQTRRRKITSYSELNAELVRHTGQPAFDFSTERDRAAMGSLLGQVVEKTRSESGAMLSAIVAYIDGNDAGPGFYKFAMHLGLLPPSPTADDCRLRSNTAQFLPVEN